jgi:hypothetical protein
MRRPTLVSRESALEARCCTWAVRQGCLPIKLGGFVVGLPDRAFLLPGGKLWLVEFKTPIGKVSARQKYHFEKLANLGHPVSLCNSYTIFQIDLGDRTGKPRRRAVQMELDMP